MNFSWFGRNLDALDECINDFEWRNLVEGSVSDESLNNNLSFIGIENVRDILPNNDYERSCIFGILYTICNSRIFILIDKSDMDFVLGEVENYGKLVETEH
jgi:hypothetical protein